VEAMADTRNELSNYREFMEISERIKRSEPKKETKDRMADGPISRNQWSASKSSPGASFAKEPKVSSSGKTGSQGCRMFQVTQERALRQQVS